MAFDGGILLAVAIKFARLGGLPELLDRGILKGSSESVEAKDPVGLPLIALVDAAPPDDMGLDGSEGVTEGRLADGALIGGAVIGSGLVGSRLLGGVIEGEAPD